MAEKYTQRASNPFQYVYVCGGHKGSKKFNVTDRPLEDTILSKCNLPTQAEFIHGIKKIKNAGRDEISNYIMNSNTPDSVKLYVLKHIPLASLGLPADAQTEILKLQTKSAFRNKTEELVGKGMPAKTGEDGELTELVELVDQSLIGVVREDGKLPGKEFLDELTKIGVDAMEKTHVDAFSAALRRGATPEEQKALLAEIQENAKFYLDSIKLTTLKLAKMKLEALKKETFDLNLDSSEKGIRIKKIGEEINKLEDEIRKIAVRTETYKRAAEARKKGSLASHSGTLDVVLDEAEAAEITRNEARDTNKRVTRGVEKQEVVVKAVREVVASLSETELEAFAKLITTGTGFSEEAIAKANAILEEREMPEQLKGVLKGFEKGEIKTAAHKAFWEEVNKRLGKGKERGEE